MVALTSPATSAPSGADVMAPCRATADLADISPDDTASSSSGAASAASPSFTLSIASPYDVLVCWLNQSAMLRAPVPPHTPARSASATTRAWTMVSRSMQPCRATAAPPSSVRDSPPSGTAATAAMAVLQLARAVSIERTIANVCTKVNMKTGEILYANRPPPRSLPRGCNRVPWAAGK